VVGILILMGLGHGPILRGCGAYLVVEDPLAPAGAIVVTGGHTPFRAMEAAALYRQGWAPQVVLMKQPLWPEDRALQALGVERVPEWEIDLQVLRRLGVPETALRVLDERPRNSDEEVQVLVRTFRHHPLPLIVVTSKSHTRRFRWLWRKLAAPGAPRLIVRYARQDPFQPSQWWKDRRWALSVAREYLGLFHLWVGRPIGYRATE
jgi:hypothetical protein